MIFVHHYVRLGLMVARILLLKMGTHARQAGILSLTIRTVNVQYDVIMECVIHSLRVAFSRDQCSPVDGFTAL